MGRCDWQPRAELGYRGFISTASPPLYERLHCKPHRMRSSQKQKCSAHHFQDSESSVNSCSKPKGKNYTAVCARHTSYSVSLLKGNVLCCWWKRVYVCVCLCTSLRWSELPQDAERWCVLLFSSLSSLQHPGVCNTKWTLFF